ncbi:MAG: macro domain-containing protein [Myxococcales bacterium]|nr:macro domain-containing protein [Myxococcales bacterium]
MERPLAIILTSVVPDLTAAWQQRCGDLPGVRVHEGDILALDADAVVSPANSFGFMDGGIDALYTRVFGPGVQQALQEKIRARHHGELLVGAAEIVETGHQIPYLIAAPTMRVPMILRDTVHPYLAARAALLLALHGRFDDGTPVRARVRTIAFPGLGTGVGKVPAVVCARQVRAAIEDVVLGRSVFPETWVDASFRHQRLYGAAPRDLQR